MQGFSKKLLSRITSPYSVGAFSPEEASARAMRLSIGEAGLREKGAWVQIYLLVDEEDGIVADAKFQAFGPPALIGAADALCSLVLRKSYVKAMRLSADLVDLEMRDHKTIEAFPQKAHRFLNLVLDSVEEAAKMCMDIPIEDLFVPPPVDDSERTVYEGWEALSDAHRKVVIDKVIDEKIRPYVELDAGGVEVVKVEDNRVTIGYKGNCTSCHSATGATLDAIGNILRQKIFPDLMVIPDISTLR